MASLNRLRSEAPKNSHGRLSEARVAKSLGARLTPNSGAVQGAKGDARWDTRHGNWLLEMKTTTDASLSLKLEWLVKISEESAAVGRQPAVVASFVLPDGRPRPNASTQWVCMPLYLFEQLTGK